jgi:pyruvate carboxylase
MRRALAEYQVRGIRTTIPFFQWILEDEDFMAARFDTTFIDRKLGAPGSGPLQAIEPAHEDLAAIAAAVHVFTKPAAQGPPATVAASRWRDTGRSDALR